MNFITFLVGFNSGIYLAVFVAKRFVKTGVLYEIFVRGGYRMATFIALGSVIATNIHPFPFAPKNQTKCLARRCRPIFIYKLHHNRLRLKVVEDRKETPDDRVIKVITQHGCPVDG